MKEDTKTGTINPEMPEFLLKALLSLLIGGVSFGLARLFHAGAALSVVIGAVTAAGTFVSSALDFAKKCLETRKLWLENKKLGREAEEAQEFEVDKARLVRLATTQEIGKFGVSALERRINVQENIRMETERVVTREFVAALEEARPRRKTEVIHFQ